MNENVYSITGRIYKTTYGTWRWKVVVSRTEFDAAGVPEDYTVLEDSSPWRWFAVFMGRVEVFVDKRRQKRKNNPIDIRIGDKK